MIRLAQREDFEHVARRICPRHARNVCMTAFTDDPVEATAHIWQSRPIGVSFWRDAPVAVAGAVITHPNVASTFFFGTPEWGKSLLEITRWFNKDLRQALGHAGVRRVNTFAPAADPEGERWKRLMGLELEATLKGFGKNGEDFSLFVTFL